MVWNLKHIPPQKKGIDTYPKLLQLLVGHGTTDIKNLDSLNELNLEIELEGGISFTKRVGIISKFHLDTPYDKENKRYDANQGYMSLEQQYIKFRDLELKGISFREIMKVAELKMNLTGSTQCNCIANTLFDVCLTHRMCVNFITGHDYLLSIVNNSNSYFSTEAKAFIATVILEDPELILNIKQSLQPHEPIFTEISKEHIRNAMDLVIQNPWSASRFLNFIANKQLDPKAEITEDELQRYIEHATATTSEKQELISVISRQIFGSDMVDNPKSFRDALYIEAIKGRKGISDDMLELCIVAMREDSRYKYLLNSYLQLWLQNHGFFPKEVSYNILNLMLASKMLNSIRAGSEHCNPNPGYVAAENQRRAQSENNGIGRGV